jgi:hypothetical protein
MGHTVESRPRGAGRPPGTRPSNGYRSATHVHVQARLRVQDAPAFTSLSVAAESELLTDSACSLFSRTSLTVFRFCLGLFDSFSTGEVCEVASGSSFAAEFGIHRILVTPPLCRRHGGEYLVGTTSVLIKSNEMSNTNVTTQQPIGYLRPYGRPPDGPATHTHLHGSLW